MASPSVADVVEKLTLLAGLREPGRPVTRTYRAPSLIYPARSYCSSWSTLWEITLAWASTEMPD